MELRMRVIDVGVEGCVPFLFQSDGRQASLTTLEEIPFEYYHFYLGYYYPHSATWLLVSVDWCSLHHSGFSYHLVSRGCKNVLSTR
jgi:hypothetical protein